MGVIRLKAKTGYKTFRTFSSYFNVVLEHFLNIFPFPRFREKKEEPHEPSVHGVFLGAVNRIRTGDLVLTKDVLCHLSHNSIELLVPCTAFILYSIEPLLSTLFSNFIRKKEGGKSIVKLGVL